MLTYWEILTAIQSNVPVNDSYAQLWGRKSQNNYTIVTYIGTLPATLTGTKAGYLRRYKIYGNTEQTGTPTPDNPIVPQECGERTENSIDVSMFTPGYTLDGTTGLPTVSPNRAATLTPIAVSSDNAVIKLSYSGEGTFMIMYSVLNGNTLVRRTYSPNNPYIIDTSGGDTLYFCVFILEGTTIDLSKISDLMLVPGSTAPSTYIPFGYKLPLTSAGQDVDIYLGESPTTRRIKKLVLTGEETWNFYEGVNIWQFYTGNIVSGSATSPSIMSNITGYGVTANTRAYYDYGAYLVSSGRAVAFQMKGSKDTLVDVAAWKAYLAQQYANGTPVTIWYVLATEETGTLNEPLRKIGDYADTIDSTQTNAQIPTSANSTTISWAGEGLAPSKVEFEYEKKR